MATTTSGISFEEAEGSPTIDISLNGLSAQRKFVIDWADWDAFAQEAYGIYRTIAGGQVVFIAPIAFPGNRPWLFPDTMRVEPYAGAVNGTSVVSLSSGTNAYNKALVTVNYRERFDDRKSHPNSPDVPKGTYLTYNGDLGTEILATQPRAWLWENLAEPVEQDIPTVVVIPTNNFSLTWHRVPSPPHGKIGSHRGKISSSAFMGAPAGCTLFLGARMQAAFQMNDDPVLWTVEYHFAEKRHFLSTGSTSVGWNYLYNTKLDAGNEHWQRIVAKNSAGGSEYPYQSANLNELFQFE